MKIRIGYIIKKYREAHNYDQASLGRLAGISRGKVVYIENDKSTQKEDQLEKLANAMGKGDKMHHHISKHDNFSGHTNTSKGV